MPLKTASSTLALTAAAVFALSTSALAQTMVGDQEISDADLPMVTEHCEMLAADSATGTMDGAATDGTATDGAATDDTAAAGTDTTTGTDTGTDTGTMAEADDGVGTDAEDMNSAVETNAPEPDTPAADMADVDIDAITIEDCQAAGLAPM